MYLLNGGLCVCNLTIYWNVKVGLFLLSMLIPLVCNLTIYWNVKVANLEYYEINPTCL